ncbi:uncharacterized protein Triagg1_797 [Trichoderma aggressivum f. europaeum]|uniref:Uncharacterized protein n=1 Tax=Trichoderma aggressivum f. europaeum TaxID=173218 RepID=A0AAE1IJ52_9HYPO|nr:hypothetical protein Triagg1_797 [Trichoderma aggressivum f. europaeum]
MSLLSQIRGGLATAQHELSKHANAGGIHHAIGNVQTGIYSIAARLSDQSTIEKQGNLNNKAASPSEAAQEGCTHVEIRMTGGKDAPIEATTHSRAGDAVTNDEIVGECSSINTAIRDTSEVAGTDKATCTCTCSNQDSEQHEGSTNFMGNAQAAAQQLGKAAWENPLLAAATVATGTGLLVVAAPAVLTAPIMGLAGAAGFTPAGIAASSAASAIHASFGSVAAGSIFATLQSAAAGGYGVGVLAGAAQTAGGAVAGVGGVGGVLTYFKGKDKPQPESTEEEKEKNQ